MENDGASNRPSIGFPLGLGLLLVLLFCMSAFLTCYLHWQKIRALIHSSEDQNGHLPLQSASSHGNIMKPKQNGGQRLPMPVLMPGDKVPKFMALACPCEPPLVDKIAIKVQKPPTIPVPLYL